MVSKQQTSASINQLCHTAENFLVGGLVDQDDRTPQVLFAVADILVKWYAAIPGYSVLENTEDLLEDLRTAMSDLLANIETQQAEELAAINETNVRKALGNTQDMTTAELVQAILNVSGDNVELLDEHVVAWAEAKAMNEGRGGAADQRN